VGGERAVKTVKTTEKVEKVERGGGVMSEVTVVVAG
jgi:hypothetical protein